MAVGQKNDADGPNLGVALGYVEYGRWPTITAGSRRNFLLNNAPNENTVFSIQVLAFLIGHWY